MRMDRTLHRLGGIVGKRFDHFFCNGGFSVAEYIRKLIPDIIEKRLAGLVEWRQPCRSLDAIESGLCRMQFRIPLRGVPKTKSRYLGIEGYDRRQAFYDLC